MTPLQLQKSNEFAKYEAMHAEANKVATQAETAHDLFEQDAARERMAKRKLQRLTNDVAHSLEGAAAMSRRDGESARQSRSDLRSYFSALAKSAAEPSHPPLSKKLALSLAAHEHKTAAKAAVGGAAPAAPHAAAAAKHAASVVHAKAAVAAKAVAAKGAATATRKLAGMGVALKAIHGADTFNVWDTDKAKEDEEAETATDALHHSKLAADREIAATLAKDLK